MILHGACIIQNFATDFAAFCHFLTFQQSICLRFANYAYFYLRRCHMNVQFASDKKTHCACKTSIGLHYLRWLFLNDKSTRDKRTEKLCNLSVQSRKGISNAWWFTLKFLLQTFCFLDLLSSLPDQFGETLAPLLNGV